MFCSLNVVVDVAVEFGRLPKTLRMYCLLLYFRLNNNLHLFRWLKYIVYCYLSFISEYVICRWLISKSFVPSIPIYHPLSLYMAVGY